MRFLVAFLVATTGLLCLLRVSQGLQCYDCLHTEMDGHGYGDEGCQYESLAEELDQYSVECNAKNSVASLGSSGEVLTVADLMESGQVSPDEQFLYGCGKLRIEGHVLGMYVKDTNRTCFAVSAGTEVICDTRTKAEWDLLEGNDDWVRIIRRHVVGLLPDNVIDACLCYEDRCNGNASNATRLNFE